MKVELKVGTMHFKKINNLESTEEEIFSELIHFLLRKNNRLLSNKEVIELTGISNELIFKWVKTGKLKASLFPNLGTPCERCGSLTNHSRICRKCSDGLLGTIESEEKDKLWFEKLQKNQRKNTYRRYR